MPSHDVERASARSSTRSPSSDGNAAIDAEKQEALSKLDSTVINVGDEDEQDPFKHLPPHEKEILHRQLDVPKVKISYVTLYRYATRNDLLISAISVVCAIAGGAMMPLMTV